MRTLLNRLTGGVLGSVRGTNAAHVVPATEFPEPVVEPTLKEELLERHGSAYPITGEVEVILPPPLDIKEMAAQREASHKAVPVANVHHRAVVKDVTESKGVTVEVISDDQLPPADTTCNAEVIVHAPQITVAPDDQADAADLRFWWAFIQRIESRNEIMTFKNAQEILAAKPELSKGYHAVRLVENTGPCSALAYKHNGTGIGVVHVTKNNINALVLVDAYKGIFRTVSANHRFLGAPEVGIAEAKAFLNGR